MSVDKEFTGLNTKELIKAADDVSIQLAQSTEQFINEVKFDEQRKVRNVQFGYTKKADNPDSIINHENMNAPLTIYSARSQNSKLKKQHFI